MSYISTHIIKYMSMYRHMSFDAICFAVDIQTYISIQTCLYVAMWLGSYPHAHIFENAVYIRVWPAVPEYVTSVV